MCKRYDAAVICWTACVCHIRKQNDNNNRHSLKYSNAVQTPYCTSYKHNIESEKGSVQWLLYSKWKKNCVFFRYITQIIEQPRHVSAAQISVCCLLFVAVNEYSCQVCTFRRQIDAKLISILAGFIWI